MQHEEHANIVEHQARDHFARAELDLEQRRNQHHDAANHRRNQHAEHRVPAGVHVDVDAAERGDKPANHHDAFAREVELVARKHYADREAGKDGRNHGRENRIEPLRIEARNATLERDQRAD
ncbi:hypothetical protein SDC9_173706 [bioreactor metagenome]|uniref:Uncharacterized protein n=1 Tax=bioreactor metagenome TaxID=1076179 RepID=A0A645GK92_9ZZZZ